MKTYRLASREGHPEDSIIKVNDNLTIGGSDLIIIAGPCAVESRDLYLEAALLVKAGGAQILRGGAFKPRTSPYSFSGLAQEGLEILVEARAKTGLPVVTEVMDVRDLELVIQYADILQVGSRNMQNFSLLQEVGKTNKPVLLKRGFAATILEWLLAAEHIMKAGNHQVILCERGVRTFETFTRNTIDLGAVVAVKELSHLPVIVDPSHGTGRASMVAPIARAAIAAGADGIIVEVHQNPDQALSDGFQSITPEAFTRMVIDLRRIADAVGRNLPI
ncbi:MAG: 3-deoxy-7-phosphoheptulonate synthase [Syntrophomonadaceae bacterium]|nr:3-deoxy-7-phosphoheptulonate synthase [Syntrophomonadaceae bacterium]